MSKEVMIIGGIILVSTGLLFFAPEIKKAVGITK